MDPRQHRQQRAGAARAAGGGWLLPGPRPVPGCSSARLFLLAVHRRLPPLVLHLPGFALARRGCSRPRSPAPHAQSPGRGTWPSVSRVSMAGPRSDWSERPSHMLETATQAPDVLRGKEKGRGEGQDPPKVCSRVGSSFLSQPSGPWGSAQDLLAP